MLVCKNIHKTFLDGSDEIKILKGITLDVKPSETLAIVGASGSGKSTLLHVLSGLESTDSGVIIIDDIDLSTLSENQLCKLRLKKIGFIYQFHHLIKELNVRENISLPLMIDNYDGDLVNLKTNEIIEKVGLKHRADFQIDKLSGGERQRVAIARSIVHQPKIIFADEPTGNLDKANAKNIFSLLTDLANFNNSSLIVATHDVEMSSLLRQKVMIENGSLKTI
jgi:lipoprotein-releasing system ATP-binding protein